MVTNHLRLNYEKSAANILTTRTAVTTKISAAAARCRWCHCRYHPHCSTRAYLAISVGNVSLGRSFAITLAYFRLQQCLIMAKTVNIRTFNRYRYQSNAIDALYVYKGRRMQPAPSKFSRIGYYISFHNICKEHLANFSKYPFKITRLCATQSTINYHFCPLKETHSI